MHAAQQWIARLAPRSNTRTLIASRPKSTKHNGAGRSAASRALDHLEPVIVEQGSEPPPQAATERPDGERTASASPSATSVEAAGSTTRLPPAPQFLYADESPYSDPAIGQGGKVDPVQYPGRPVEAAVSQDGEAPLPVETQALDAATSADESNVDAELIVPAQPASYGG